MVEKVGWANEGITPQQAHLTFSFYSNLLHKKMLIEKMYK